ncbi:DJ-1/PfpI family protein [Sphingomonas sp. RT2P30]|uniref:DJ-1/PfpI family protein n=1 Tax=Parasphingomonas halimpatiens TaxID=3096162 RepID=UPI002FC58C33
MTADLQLRHSDSGAGSQIRRPLVAILIFDDVEVLDFAGPFEVFGVARDASGDLACEVVTVALAAGAIVARNGLKLVPHGTAADLGVADILVVPGGMGTRRELTNPAMLDFIRSTSNAASLTLSVCTGSLLLGAAGLLAGLSSTTHRDAMDELRGLNCGVNIYPDARIVDNGRIVTSAGISAGIDAALYVIARLFGDPSAAETARYMQYDWSHRSIDGTSVMKVDP